MNIGILLLNEGRGSGEVARQHAEYLAHKKHNVYFLHPHIKHSSSVINYQEIILHTEIVPVHEYLPSASKNQKAVSTMSYHEAVSYLPDYETALESIVDSLDIIIGHHANLSAVAVSNVAMKYSKPYVLFLHGTGIEPRHKGLYDDNVWSLIQNAIEKADGIIVTTEYVRDHLVKNIIDIPDDKFIILPCGVDLDKFHPEIDRSIIEKYKLPETFVICPGALTFIKGPQNVVKASEYYAVMAFTIFIGDGDLRKKLEPKLGRRGCFLGFVSAEDKAKLINAATLLVAAPEKNEHFGIIYVEGLAAETPTVAYKGGGVSSIVTSETGILTERNPEDLGKTVRYLLQDTKKYDQMAKACRLRAEKYFSYDNLGAKLEKWLEGIRTQ